MTENNNNDSWKELMEIADELIEKHGFEYLAKASMGYFERGKFKQSKENRKATDQITKDFIEIRKRKRRQKAADELNEYGRQMRLRKLDPMNFRRSKK